MPSIRLLAIPRVRQWFLDNPFQDRKLTSALRVAVAEELPYDIRKVEVYWLPVDDGDNISPFAVEILYSVKPDFNPTEERRNAVADRVNKTVASIAGLPEEVWETTSWVLPQHDAVFKGLEIRPKP